MDVEVVANAVGVIVVSLSGWLTARKARNVSKAAKDNRKVVEEVNRAVSVNKVVVEEGQEQVVSKLDILLRTVERIDHRLIRTEASVNEHLEWHLKERSNHHG